MSAKSWNPSDRQVDTAILAALNASGGRLGGVLIQRTQQQLWSKDKEADRNRIAERADALVQSGRLRRVEAGVVALA